MEHTQSPTSVGVINANIDFGLYASLQDSLIHVVQIHGRLGYDMNYSIHNLCDRQ
jgi:hypothetical protein